MVLFFLLNFFQEKKNFKKKLGTSVSQEQKNKKEETPADIKFYLRRDKGIFWIALLIHCAVKPRNPPIAAVVKPIVIYVIVL